MASSFSDLLNEISKLQEFLQDPNPGLSTWEKSVSCSALETRRIIDELIIDESFAPSSLVQKKEKALMFALERTAGGIYQRLSQKEEHERFARIFEAAKKIHHAPDKEEFNQSLDDLIEA